MGIVIRQSVKGSISAYIGVLIGFLNYLFIFPLALSTEQIGLYRLLLDSSMFIMPFVQAGVVSIAMRFYPYFTDDPLRYRRFKGYIFIVPLITFVIFSVAAFIFEDQLVETFIKDSSLLGKYYPYILPLVFIFVYNAVLEAHIRNKLRIVVPKIIRENVVRLLLMGVVCLYYIQFISFDTVVMSIVIIYVAQFIMLNIYAYLLERKVILPSVQFYKDPLFGEMAQYSFYMLLASSGSIIVAKIDTLMTYSFLDESHVGVYSVAFFIGAVLELPKRTISSIMSPLVAKAIKNEDMPELKEYYFKSSLNQIIIGSILFIFVWSNIDNIFNIIPGGEAYRAGKYVVLFIAISRLSGMAIGVNNAIIANSKYYRWNIFLMPFLGAITIATNIIFIPMYGIVGTALATVISLLMVNLASLLLVYIKFKIHPFSLKTLKALLIAVAVFLLAYLLPAITNPFIDLIVRVTVSGLSFGALIIYSNVSEDINDQYTKLKRRFLG